MVIPLLHHSLIHPFHQSNQNYGARANTVQGPENAKGNFFFLIKEQNQITTQHMEPCKGVGVVYMA